MKSAITLLLSLLIISCSDSEKIVENRSSAEVAELNKAERNDDNSGFVEYSFEATVPIMKSVYLAPSNLEPFSRNAAFNYRSPVHYTGEYNLGKNDNEGSSITQLVIQKFPAYLDELEGKYPKVKKFIFSKDVFWPNIDVNSPDKQEPIKIQFDSILSEGEYELMYPTEDFSWKFASTDQSEIQKLKDLHQSFRGSRNYHIRCFAEYKYTLKVDGESSRAIFHVGRCDIFAPENTHVFTTAEKI